MIVRPATPGDVPAASAVASASYRAAFAPILEAEELARRTPESFVARFEASLERLRVAEADGRVVFGATVELEDENSGEVVRYQIVGEDEADLKLGLVNISSPIARALIGKEQGDTAEVVAPGGIRHYEIVAVHYL